MPTTDRARDALIEFRKEWYYLGLWYAYPGLEHVFEAGKPPLRMDWLGCVWREREGAVWQLRYRSRYYVTPDVRWPSQDLRSSFRATAPPETSPAKLIEAFTLLAQKCAGHNRSRYKYLPIDGDGEKAAEILKRQDFVHMRTERVP